MFLAYHHSCAKKTLLEALLMDNDMMHENIHTMIDNFQKIKNPSDKDWKQFEEGLNMMVDLAKKEQATKIFQAVSNKLHEACQ